MMLNRARMVAVLLKNTLGARVTYRIVARQRPITRRGEFRVVLGVL